MDSRGVLTYGSLILWVSENLQMLSGCGGLCMKGQLSLLSVFLFVILSLPYSLVCKPCTESGEARLVGYMCCKYLNPLMA
jgi:hypothetical protein